MQVAITKFKRPGSDWDLALEKFLNEECPTADNNYRGAPPAGFDTRGTERRALGYELLFPPTDKHYVFSNYTIPANKMVFMKGPSVLGGAYIRAPSGTDYAFTLGTGWGAKGFEGLFFDQCGVLMEGDVRGNIVYRKCFFDSCRNDYAIKFDGMSVVDGLIEDCKFNRCMGIGILYQACDLWTIRRCRFVRQVGTSVFIKSSGILVDDCNFENTDGDTANSNLNPYIVIEPGARDDGGQSIFAGGLSTVRDCRFGDEVGSGNGPPQYSIRLGPSSPTTGTMTGINIIGNRFRGSNTPYPDSTHAQHAIYITKEVARSNFLYNDFEIFNSYILNNDPSGNGGDPRHNTWQGTVHGSHSAGIFSTGDLPPEGFKLIEQTSHTMLMFGATTLEPTTTAQRFMTPGGPIGAVSTTEYFMVCPIDGDLNKMYVTAPSGVTGTGSGNITFVAEVNQVATDHVVTIDNEASPFQGTTAGLEKHYSVSAGDTIAVRVTKQNTVSACPTNVVVTLSLNPTAQV